MKGSGHAWLCMAMRGWEEWVQRTRKETRIAEVAGMVWVQCSHVQLCRGGETLEVLNAMIKHQTQVRIQPLAGEKKSTKLSEAKIEQAFLGSWIPTANHKIRLTEDLTWIFHYVTFLSLVWISPAPSLIFFELPQLAFLPKLSKTPSRSPLSSIFFFLFLAFFPRSGNLAPAPLFPAPYSRLRIAPSPSFHFQPASGG